MNVNTSLRAVAQKLNEVALNPQPLPPKIAAGLFPGLGDSVSLNPQPLPPKAAIWLFDAARFRASW
jgi:hypothetical protein